MKMEMHRRTFRFQARWVEVLLIAGLALGCGSKETADQAMTRISKETGIGIPATAKFSGKVIIDGVPAPLRTLVILYNQDKPPRPKDIPPYAMCGDDGSFAFTTNLDGDGVPPGNYVVLFAQLVNNLYAKDATWIEPDGLKNLYNDPDKSEFKVEVKAPGKTDYLFELTTTGKEPITKPGPKAITKL